MSGRFTLRQGVRVVWTIGWLDFVMKYHGSVLGYLWSFGVPLLKFLVIYHIFRPFVGQSIERYPLYLFLGIVVWEYFANTTVGCIGMLHQKEAIIQRIPFPRILLILSVGWTNTIIFLTHVCIFFLFAFLFNFAFTISPLAFLVILLQMNLLSLGIGMLLSAYALRYRDLQHLWGVALQVLFWLTPIMYQYNARAPLADEAAQLLRHGIPLSLWRLLDVFIRFQPLSVLIHDARRVLLYASPSILHFAGFSLVCALFFATGAAVFQRRSRLFLQEY